MPSTAARKNSDNQIEDRTSCVRRRWTAAASFNVHLLRREPVWATPSNAIENDGPGLNIDSLSEQKPRRFFFFHFPSSHRPIFVCRVCMTVVDGLPRLLARFILLPIHGAHRKMNKSIDFHFIGFLPFVRAECCFAKMKLVCLVFYYNVAPMRVEQICKEDRLSVIYHFLIEWAALDALDNCASCRLRTHQNNKFSISFRRYVETVTIGNTFVKLGSHALCMRANCRNALR